MNTPQRALFRPKSVVTPISVNPVIVQPIIVEPIVVPAVPAATKAPLKVLALDPATNCGWAHSLGASGTWDLSVRRDESSGMRLIRMRGKLKEIYESVGIDILVYEAARHAGPGMQGALVVQTEIQSVIKIWCHDNHVEYRGYSPSELKKFAMGPGKGNASKELMIAEACKRWPDKRRPVEVPVSKGSKTKKKIMTIDDNEADALFLLALFQSTS